MLAFVEPLGHQMIYFAKAKMVHRGIELAIERDLFLLNIEGNSKVIIDHLSGISNPNWSIELLIADCKRMLHNK